MRIPDIAFSFLRGTGVENIAIPLAGILGVFVLFPGLFVILFYSISRQRHLERLRMIEKGIALPLAPFDPTRTAAKLRLWGIVLIALGMGIWLTSLTHVTVELPGVVRYDRPAYAPPAGAAIPLLIGMGLLLDYWLRMKDLKEWHKDSHDDQGFPPDGAETLHRA